MNGRWFHLVPKMFPKMWLFVISHPGEPLQISAGRTRSIFCFVPSGDRGADLWAIHTPSDQWQIIRHCTA